jgi:hypothetical protein
MTADPLNAPAPAVEAVHQLAAPTLARGPRHLSDHRAAAPAVPVRGGPDHPVAAGAEFAVGRALVVGEVLAPWADAVGADGDHLMADPAERLSTIGVIDEVGIHVGERFAALLAPGVDEDLDVIALDLVVVTEGALA